MQAYIHVQTGTHAEVYINADMHTYVHADIAYIVDISICIHTCMHTCMYAYMSAHVQTSIRVHYPSLACICAAAYLHACKHDNTLRE